VAESLLGEGEGEEGFEFLGCVVLDEHGAGTAAGDLEAVT
jgi:hypothetical protein